MLSKAGVEKLIEILVVEDVLPEVVFQLDQRPFILPGADVNRSGNALDRDLVLHMLALFMGVLHLGWLLPVEHLLVSR